MIDSGGPPRSVTFGLVCACAVATTNIAAIAAERIRFIVFSSLAQSTPIECDQPFPMPLRRRLVVAPPLRESEAVMDAHLDLQLPTIARFGEQRLPFLHHLGRREIVMLGTGDVELAL